MRKSKDKIKRKEIFAPQVKVVEKQSPPVFIPPPENKSLEQKIDKFQEVIRQNSQQKPDDSELKSLIRSSVQQSAATNRELGEVLKSIDLRLANIENNKKDKNLSLECKVHRERGRIDKFIIKPLS